MKGNNKRPEGRGRKVPKRRIILIAAVLVVLMGAAGGIFIMTASDNPAFCTACHIMNPYYESYHEENRLASKHAEAGLVCHDCHESSLAVQAEEGWKFITGDYQTPLEKRVFERDFCLECHDDFDEVKAQTDFEESNPHDSHNGEMECNLCHSMHQQSTVMCSQCHLFLWTQDLDDSWAI